MKASFWHDKWQTGNIPFHEKQANAMLVKYFTQLNLDKGSRVFLPLCGKTRDIQWLLTQGYKVVGAELSELAVTELFSNLNTEPQITKTGELMHYKANNIDLFVGDVFELNAQTLGAVDAIYDRAALVALPPQTRIQYTQHLITISHGAPQLLITFEYDQTEMDGPPFSISPQEIQDHYTTNYKISALESADVAGGLKGKVTANETISLLQPSN